MTVRFSHLLRSRTSRAASRGAPCDACGEEIFADGHGIQLAGGIYHAGCVLYRPRPQAAMPPGGTRLGATR